MHLIHLIYASTATQEFTEVELAELLREARASNERLQITGMLLYSNGSFFQILEGSASAVDELFDRIADDPRHAHAATIIREPIAKRAFGEWTMGFAALNQREFIDGVGLNDFFDKASCFSALTRGRTKKLLTAFAAGRWRAKLGGATTTNSALVAR